MYLYSVWRNSDDRLLILDGTMRECLTVMNMTRTCFYRFMCEYHGRNGKWTVTRNTPEEIKKDEQEGRESYERKTGSKAGITAGSTGAGRCLYSRFVTVAVAPRDRRIA